MTAKSPSEPKAVRAQVPPSGTWADWLPEPGRMYVGLPEDVYHASPGISKHGLDDIHRAPAYFRHRKDNPPDDADASEALVMGGALDSLVFEPEDFDRRYLVDETGLNRNSKAWKEWRDENQHGRAILRPKQYESLARMREAIYAQPYAAALLADGIAQPAAYWTDTVERVTAREPTGRLCRARLDWLCEGHSVALDLKTVPAGGGRSGAFARSVARYRYHVQESYYMAGLTALGVSVECFVFLVVEKDPPHLVSLFVLDSDWVDLARTLWERDMETYDMCTQAGEWPAYPPEPRALAMPRWAANVGDTE